ncbi:hypothetical protein Hypma_011318 [Hypsizygus marmoreus]|uniref:Uncharacterized protein n=1 Tax=Hypsizygus marmoreus TaxID=39966 RepID=A0A369JFL5_HYPMA|nr:hypothetical protein Hypma_011318 [Hypsizygus marmoreus]
MQTPTHIDYCGISLFSDQSLIECEFECAADRVKVLSRAEYPVVGAGFAVWQEWSLAAYQVVVEIDFLRCIYLRKNVNLPLIHNERFINFKVTNWLNVMLERGRGTDGSFVDQPVTPIMLSTDQGDPIGPPVPMVVNPLPSGWATSVHRSASYSLTMPSLERQSVSPDVVATPERIALDSVQETVGILYAAVSAMRSGDEELGCHLLEAAQEGVTAIGEMMSTVGGHGMEAGMEEKYVEMQD